MKKRNKKYRPKLVGIPAIIPMASVLDVMPDMSFHLFRIFDAALDEPTKTTIDDLGGALVSLASALSMASRGVALQDKTDAASLAIKSAIRAYEDIDRRADRTGVIAVSANEALTLRNAAGVLEWALKTIPAHVWNAAMLTAETSLKAEAAKRGVQMRDTILEAA